MNIETLYTTNGLIDDIRQTMEDYGITKKDIALDTGIKLPNIYRFFLQDAENISLGTYLKVRNSVALIAYSIKIKQDEIR